MKRMIAYETKLKILSDFLSNTASGGNKPTIHLRRPALLNSLHENHPYEKKSFRTQLLRAPALFVQGWKQLRHVEVERLRHMERAWEVKFVNEVPPETLVHHPYLF
jgi:hypothetical protein